MRDLFILPDLPSLSDPPTVAYQGLLLKWSRGELKSEIQELRHHFSSNCAITFPRVICIIQNKKCNEFVIYKKIMH